MPLRSEGSLGARLGNARIFHQRITTFSQNKPPAKVYIADSPETTVDAYHTLVDEASAYLQETAASIQDYTMAVDDRQKVFNINSYSLKKVLSPIGGTVRGTFGKKSKEATTLATMVEKIRGAKLKKGKKSPDEASVSQSERGYNNLTQMFSNIISSLEKHRIPYNPPDNNIKLDALKTLLQTLIENNLAVPGRFFVLKQNRDLRTNAFDQLNIITQRIKESIKGQFGVNSVEYKSVKGLKI